MALILDPFSLWQCLTQCSAGSGSASLTATGFVQTISSCLRQKRFSVLLFVGALAVCCKRGEKRWEVWVLMLSCYRAGHPVHVCPQGGDQCGGCGRGARPIP